MNKFLTEGWSSNWWWAYSFWSMVFAVACRAAVASGCLNNSAVYDFCGTVLTKQGQQTLLQFYHPSNVVRELLYDTAVEQCHQLRG
jgi:hypothetical protein